jgi:hypothetical protein
MAKGPARSEWCDEDASDAIACRPMVGPNGPRVPIQMFPSGNRQARLSFSRRKHARLFAAGITPRLHRPSDPGSLRPLTAGQP